MRASAGRRWAAAAALLLALALALPPGAAEAGGWVYPGRNYRGADGEWVFPTSDGRRFDSVLAREEYLRRSRDIRRRADQAGRAAEERRRAAEVPDPAPVALPRRTLPVERLGDEQEELRRRQRAGSVEAQRRRQELLQRYLGESGGRDAAGIRADLAQRRAAGARRLSGAEDRLYRGAEAARQTLGESERRPIGPLIRTPRVEGE